MQFGLLRSDDMLVLDFETFDLRLDSPTGAIPVLVPQGAQPRLTVRFPAQHIVEQAFGVGATVRDTHARISEPSQLVFRVTGELPLTVASLLDWQGPKLQALLPVATAPFDSQETFLELPYRLLLAPGEATHWEHKDEPVSIIDSAGKRWTELWQTGLEAASGQRAVWAAGARLKDAADPFGLIALDKDDRKRIAVQSRSRTKTIGHADIPVDRLSLSALGATLDLSVAWEDIPANPLAEWRHATAVGRDVAVRVTTRGFLKPFGHRAGLTKITERRFTRDGWAALEQRSFLTVLEPERRFTDRDMPLQRVRIETVTTPILDPLLAGGWLLVGGEPFPFQLTAEDFLNQKSSFTLPMAFVEAGSTADDAVENELIDDLTRQRRRANLAGQAVAMASAAPGDLSTTVATQFMQFGVEQVPSSSSMAPSFRPRMDQASVDLPAVNRLLGGKGDVDIKIPTLSASTGPGQIVAEFVGNGLQVATAAQQAGGFIAPQLNFVGLSRTLGPVSGRGSTAAEALETISSGSFDPRSFLGASTKIFGTIDLTDLIPTTTFGSSPGGDQIDVDKVVKLVDSKAAAERSEALRKELEEGDNANRLIKVPTMASHELRDALGVPIGVDLTWLWKPKLQPPPGGFLTFHLDPNSPRKTRLWIATRTVARLNEAPETRVEGHLTTFDLSLFGAMTVGFKRLSFVTEHGKRMEVTPEIDTIEFAGKLNFVKELAKVLQAIGGDSPFSIDVQPTLVKASYSLGLPGVSMGAFALENIRLSTAVMLPFIESAGPVRIRFAIAERSAPFLVTYTLFAGGGFFAVELNTRGDVALEASIEFGGKLAIDLVVAKGGVYALAGIYFSWRSGEGVRIEAFLRAGGYVEILGIVTISIEFYIGLEYRPNENKLVGRAKVTACIEVLFFSECVSFEVQREIKGPIITLDSQQEQIANDAADQPAPARSGTGFADLVDPSAWKEYCAAFA